MDTQVGDFILKRADGLYAYQLAVAVDDALQGITEVVRGVDLLGSTPQQIYLQQLLGYTSPRYIHHPVALNVDGQKLSKQNLALALDTGQPVQSLWKALIFLGQNPPADLQGSDLVTLWSWAFTHWDLSAVPHRYGLPVDETGQLSDR
jgi:glutamyl-Q tRNA(Asp) synthetase